MKKYVGFVGLLLLLLASACTTPEGQKTDNTAEKLKETQKDTVVEALGIKREAIDAFDQATQILTSATPDLGKAEELLKKALSISPNFLEAQYNLGVVQEKRGKFDEAIDAYRKAMEQDKLNTHATKFLLAIGRAQALSGKGEDAARTFEEALRLDPSNIDILNSLGASYANAGRWDQALDYVKKVLKEDNKNITALNTLAQIYTGQDNRSMAVYVYKKAARLALGTTKSDEDLSAEPAVLVKTGKVELDKANRPMAADLLNNLGLIYLKKGELPLAVANFQAAVDLDPSEVEARLNLGAIYLRYLNYEGAKEQFGKAFEVAPGNCTARLGRSASLYAVGEKDNALASYQSVLENCDEKDTSVHLQLEKLYEQKQDFPNAIKHCEKFVEYGGQDKAVNAEYCKALQNMSTMKREEPMQPEGENPEGGAPAPEGGAPEGGAPAPEGGAPAPEGGAPAPEGGAPAPQ